MGRFRKSQKHKHNPTRNLPVLPMHKLESLLGIEPPTPAKPTTLSGGAIEARGILDLLKEKDMPDIRSEMAKVAAAVAAWDDEPDAQPETKRVPLPIVADTPAPAPQATPPANTKFGVTNNITRTAFEFLLANPDKYRPFAIAKMLEPQGFKTASTTSIVAQFIKAGYAGVNSDGTVYPKIKEYIPMGRVGSKPSAAKAKKLAEKKVVAKTPAVQRMKRNLEPFAVPVPEPIKAAPAAPAAPAPTPKPAAPAVLTAADVLATLSVKEAHALYKELQSMFN